MVKKPYECPGLSVLKINEIFYSIQGESSYSGLPTVFVRTTGCHLRCTYCDTTYSYYEGTKYDSDKIIEQVLSYGTKYVCITGGEPLLQEDVFSLMTELCDHGLVLSLETSGSISCEKVDPRVKIILDIKTPDSGAEGCFLLENLNLCNVNTEIKFVICSEKDWLWSVEFCKTHQLFEKFIVLFSPSFSEIDNQWLAKKILSKKLNARLQLQLHKYIWSPETKSV